MPLERLGLRHFDLIYPLAPNNNSNWLVPRYIYRLRDGQEVHPLRVSPTTVPTPDGTALKRRSKLESSSLAFFFFI